MFSGFFGHWQGMKPSHQLITLIVLIIIAVGTNLIAIACSAMIMQFASNYVILILGILLSAVGILLSLMKPHPITITIIGLGIILILAGVLLGG
jgi:hypothetical protein